MMSTEGTLVFAIDGSVFGSSGFVGYQGGNYTVKPSDDTSGVIVFVDPMDPTASEVVFTYSDLAETSVKVSNEAPFMLDNCEMTLVTDPVAIK